MSAGCLEMADYKATATLPPAANWYSANILAAGPGGWLAWGAKNSLVLLHDGEAEAGDTEGGYPRVLTQHEATGERGKVTAVAWCPQPGGAGRDRAQLVSGAEDGALTSWRLDTESGQLARCGHTAAGMGRVTSLSWSAADPGLVLAAGETGGSVVTVWDLVTGTASQASYGKQMVFSVACHPGRADTAALGCKLGLVLIVNIEGSGRVLQKMRGHDEDVYGVAWSPASTGLVLGGQEHEGWLVASSSRDRTVRVWSAAEGRTLHTIKLPPGPGQDRRQQGAGQHSWVTCSWPAPATLLSSGAGGELLAWQLDKPGRKGQGSEWRVLSREHARNLFSIAVDSARGRVYTVAQDRSVVATSLTGTRLYSLPCFAGFVYAVASNPIEPSTLAIGAGDGLIR